MMRIRNHGKIGNLSQLGKRFRQLWFVVPISVSAIGIVFLILGSRTGTTREGVIITLWVIALIAAGLFTSGASWIKSYSSSLPEQYCFNCNYDLCGQYDANSPCEVCPECGLNPSEKTSATNKHEVRHQALGSFLILLGILVTIVLLFYLSMFQQGALTAGGV
ncbi:MAG: hypothetical protein ACI9JK_000864 [Phycisphaerales bacterium]|jgi:hypothetical protein